MTDRSRPSTWALLAGGAGAIGREIADRLADAQITVVVADIRQPTGTANSHEFVKVDLANFQDTMALAKQLCAQLDPPRYVISTVGLYERRSLFDYDEDHTDTMLRSNFSALLSVARAFLAPMIDVGHGRLSYNRKLWIRDRLKGATYPPS